MLFTLLIALAGFAGSAEASPKIEFSSSCAPYKRMLTRRIEAASARLKDCLSFAYVRPDIAERMLKVLDAPYTAARLRCDEPPRSTWCAAAGWGEIWMSPSKMLDAGSFCHNDIESYFIHEVAHLAGLRMSAGHNEEGDNGLADEVYSLTNYCLRPARMWLGRAYRTADVVPPESLWCVREYQELTPETLVDPFWEAYKPSILRGKEPCTHDAIEQARKQPQPIAPRGRKGS